MTDRRIPNVHGPVEESAWEGGGRVGLSNFREHHHGEERSDEQLMVSDEEIEDKRRPAPGHWAITPGAMGPTTREDGTVPGANGSAVGKSET